MPRSTSPILPKTSPLPKTTVEVQRPSFMQTVQEGLAFGAGSSIARNIIDRLMPGQLPPSRVCHEPCVIEMREYENCIITHDREVFCGDKKKAYNDCLKERK